MDEKITQWLDIFFKERTLEEPDGRPLYQYATTEREYYELSDFLKENSYPFSPFEQKKWASCYCLVVSEFYRREYDSKWSLTKGDITGRVPTDFSVNERYQIIRDGFLFWQRKLIVSDRVDYIGSLFREGGLPWTLLQNDRHGFGHSVKYGLKHYQKNIKYSRPIKESIKETWERWPRAFQNEGTAILFAEIVKQLMILADDYKLKAQSDPATYLDKIFSDWRYSFPLPLDKSNARKLINEWLSTASTEWEKKDTPKKAQFEVSHTVNSCSLEKCTFVASIIFPDNYSIDLKEGSAGTRLEWVAYEGNQATNIGGIVYAEKKGNKLEVNFTNQAVGRNKKIIRQYAEELINIRFYGSGQLIGQEFLLESDINFKELLCFTKDGNDWNLLPKNNPTSQQLPYLIRLPDKTEIIDEHNSNVTFRNEDIQSGRWYEVDGKLTCMHDDNEELIIEVDSSLYSEDVSFRGKTLINAESSRPIYLGYPQFYSESLKCSKIIINKQHKYLNEKEPAQYGQLKIAYYDENEHCLYQQRLQILPKDFCLEWQHCPKGEVILSIESDSPLNSNIYGEGIEILALEKNKKYRLIPCDITTTNLRIELSNKENNPIVIETPFPYQGARLYDENRRLINDESTLLIDQLMGKQLVLASSEEKELFVFIEFKLLNEEFPFKYTVEKKITNAPLKLNLYSLKSIIDRLLSLSNSLDSTVSLSVLPNIGGQWLRLYFKRYEKILKVSEDKRWIDCIDEPFSSSLPSQNQEAPLVKAMLFVDPNKEFGQIQRSEGELRYLIPDYMRNNTPWLLYPDSESPIQFRPKPYLFQGNIDSTTVAEENLGGLPQAAIEYNPKDNPNVFEKIIKDMAEDFDDASWKYIEDLKNNYSHLPLSTFEVWKNIAKNPKALAAVVTRLGLDEAFCHRLVHELAVVWDFIPISAWILAVDNYKKYLKNLGISEDTLSVDVLKQVIPLVVTNNSDELREYLVKRYLKQDVTEELMKIILKTKYQEIRQVHSEQTWPDDLHQCLYNWLKKESKYKAQQWLESTCKYDYSVVFLPLFIACLKTGKATIEELKIPKHEFINAYYKIVEFDDDWFNYTCAILTCYLSGEGE